MIKRIIAFIGLRITQCFFKKHESATRFLERISKFAPSYAHSFFHLGCKFLESGKYQKAICYFKKAIDCNPRNSVYHTFLGLTLYDADEYILAREAFSRSLALDSNNQLTYNCLALCHLGQGNFENFCKLIEDKGIFESADVQSRLLLAMETYRSRLDLPTKQG